MLKRLLFISAIILITVPISTAQKSDSISVSAFGDIHYNDVIHQRNVSDTPGKLEVHRFNIIGKYKFNELFSLYSELSFRNFNISEDSEVVLNQAYIDINPRFDFGIRGGLLLVPIGLTNLNRSPTDFHGVEQPNVEKHIIPTTWKEMGIGVYGSTKWNINYKVYVLTGLKPSRITGAYGIRDARQNGSQSSTGNMALLTRLDYQLNENLTLGASYYISTIKKRIEDGSGANIPSLSEGIFNMGVGHLRYQKKQFEARGLFALSRILDVEDLNRTFGNAAGQIQAGGYLELSYNFLPLIIPQTNQQLFMMARYESFDTNLRTGNEIQRSNEYLRDEFTVGFSYKPVSQLSLKADYQWLTSFVSSRNTHQINMGMGFHF